MQRDLVVTAYQSASGIVNLITPTLSRVVMGGLAIARVPYVRLPPNGSQRLLLILDSAGTWLF